MKFSFLRSCDNFDKIIKNDIMRNSKLYWPGILYLLAIPVGILACYSSIKLGLSNLKDPTKFHPANLWIALSCAFLFACKIPFVYIHNKPLATGSFVLNLIGWLLAVIIFVIVWDKQNNMKYEPEK